MLIYCVFCEWSYAKSKSPNSKGEWSYARFICCEYPLCMSFDHRFLISVILNFNDFENGMTTLVYFNVH